MSRTCDKPLMKWLELSVSACWKKNDATLTVHPVSMGENQQCFALTLDQRWLCGSDGALTFFDSKAAATRFLELLNVNDYVEGDDGVGLEFGVDPFQCFQYGAKGLKSCDKCARGDESRSAAVREFARWEERW